MKCQASALLCVIALLAFGVGDHAEGTMTNTTVYQIQQGNFTPGVDSVYVDSVLVTAVDRKTDTYGFHVQELAGGPWSGILCYLDIQYPTVNEGDLVTVWGQYDEYFDHSEIELVNANVVIIEPKYAEPACTLLSCEDLSHFAEADSDWAEKWEGVFICVDTVQVGGHGPYGEWSVAE